MTNLIAPNFKIDNYLSSDGNMLNYGINFVNWFQMHNGQEKLAMDICNHMKIRIIPAYVQLARTYQNLFDKQSQRLTENELIFDCTKLSDINALLGRSLKDFQQIYFNKLRLNGQFSGVDFQNQILKGLFCRPDFKNRKWMKIFNHCELTACKLLYSMIAFLDQNLFIGSNTTPRQHDDMADDFFHQSLRKFIAQNYRKIRYLMLKDRFRKFTHWPFVGLISKLMLKLICFLSFMPTIFSQSLINTISDLLFDLFQKELKLLGRSRTESSKNISDNIKQQARRFDFPKMPKKMRQILNNSKFDNEGDYLNFVAKNEENRTIENEIQNETNLFAENRFHLVIDQARVSVADFCVSCVKALTGTLFHFWIIKEPLTDCDIEVLKEYKDVFKGIEDDIYSALHKYVLSTQLKLRPYGFIMNSALLDNLPSDLWQRNIRNEMRTWLQECISIFLNWNFEFVTVYPRPIQSQYTKMSHVSSLYQSMIESLIDFKVVYVLANQLNDQISQCFYEDKTNDFEHNKSIKKPKFFKTNINPTTQLPWILVRHLEANFVCKEVDLKMKQTINSKILPSILLNEPTSNVRINR